MSCQQSDIRPMRKESWIARGKHCKSQKGNAWRKVVSGYKKMILERDQHFLAVGLSQIDLSNVFMRKM